jgi:hypothetical protein
MRIDPIRGSIWTSHVNTVLGALLLGSVALWAAIVILRVAWNTDPVSNAFAAAIAQESALQ